MTDENEEPRTAKIAEAAIGKQQRQRDRESGNRKWQRDDFLDDPGKTPSPDVQRIGCRDAGDQRDRQRRERDQERQQYGPRIELPDLDNPM